ncbi:MAG: hypothetical protein KGD63_04315 [Candidatus Lokiarchaeota archaeon]|nr:hypothetical protein [Candidatus Lokiarchaeota archaeon]
MKCHYYEEDKEDVQNLDRKLSILFLGPKDFKSMYHFCKSCLEILKKEGSLNSKDGECTAKLN